MIVTRQSPVKIQLPKPIYVSVSSDHGFRTQNPGFGSRHIYDTAPFCLWDYDSTTFREPLARELDWMFTTYQARAISVTLPDIIIRTDSPPNDIPLTVGGALARFVPADMVLPNIPVGPLKPYPNSQRSDLLSSDLPLYSIPSQQQCQEILRLLELEVTIRAIHFLPPHIIVELDTKSGRKYDRRSLPSRAGGISIQYHEADENYWKGSSQMAYERLNTPTANVVDDSDYLYNNPHEISAGVCLASSFVMEGNIPTTKWLSTSAGLLMQKSNRKCISVANHGFPDSPEVYHPSPTGCRIGQITDRFPGWDLAFVQLESSVSFSNEHYFSAPRPSRLVSVEEIRAGDWFEVDAYSAGRVGLCARGRTYYRPDVPDGIEPTPIRIQDWNVETAYSLFGMSGAPIKEGICGAPVVDHMGRVAGMFRGADQSGMWAHTIALDSIINSGWSLI